MNLDGNSLYGDDVLDGVNMAYRDEDNICYQIYERQIYYYYFIMNISNSI